MHLKTKPKKILNYAKIIHTFLSLNGTLIIDVIFNK